MKNHLDAELQRRQEIEDLQSSMESRIRRHMRMRECLIVAVGLLVVLFCLISAQAQTNRAGVTGTIEDPSGAGVAGAQVKVLNLETGQEFTTTTSAEGVFAVPSVLPPGRYKVEASHPGFKTTVSEAFILQIGEVKSVKIGLQLGQVQEQVTVTSSAALLQTETSSTGEVITGRETVELPLNQRNFTELAILTPGVTRSFVGTLTDQTFFNQGDPNAGSVPGLGDPRGDTPAGRFGRSGGSSISVNGLRPSNNNFTLDGVDNNEAQYQSIGVFPNPDAIQEFRVETSMSKAEVGRGGASINAAFKAGTNELHGNVFYFGQNDALNATPWLINRDRAADPKLKKSTIRVNEFGFTVGGPIIKNRTFFFGDYLGQRNSIPNFFESTVPTAKTRNGDFSEFLDQTNKILPVIDPLTCTKPGDISSGGCSTFAGGVITGLQSRSDFSAQAFKLLNLFPSPTVNINNPNNGGNHNFFGTRANEERINNFDVKLDQHLTDKNNLSGRYTLQDLKRVRANFFPKLPTAGFGSGDEIGNSRQIAVSDTHIFRPTLLNEARFGWTRVEIGILNCGVEGSCGVSPTFCNDIGIPNCNKGTNGTSGGLLTGGFGTGEFEFTGDGGLFIDKSGGFYAADNLTIVSGKHTWKTGVEVRPRRLDTLCGGCAGFLKGHLQFPTGGPQTTGNVQADYLLGRPAVQAFSGTILGGDNPFQLRETEWSFFVQDDWKATPGLTLNLGMRYEVFPGFHEVNGRLANFDVATSTIIKAKGGDSLVDTDMKDFGPRVGFAYSFGPQHHFVLRGGYGLFYTRDTMDIPPLTRNPPLTNTVTFSAFSGNQANFNLTTGPPVAPVIDPPVVTSNLSYDFLPRSQRLPQISEWNLILGWQFAQEWALDIGYVGNRAHHLLATRELGSNQNGLGLAKTPTNQFIGDVTAFENRANSQYDALQTHVEKRFSQGFLWGANYTWGHAIDDSTGVFQSAGEVRGAAGGPANPFNFRLDRSNSSSDRRHIFTSDLIWDLPFGRGKKYGSDINRALGKFIGGWQANFIWTAQSGQPFTVAGSSPIGSTRADLLCDPFASPPTDRYINVTCFGPAQQFVTNLAGNKVFFGNVGRNAFRGPGYFRTDFSMFKKTAITERIEMQFGIELFNTFNQTHHLVPNNTINDFSDPTCFPKPTGSCGFGRFDNALPPRTAQYRMKFTF
jgi:hypothetical protein